MISPPLCCPALPLVSPVSRSRGAGGKALRNISPPARSAKGWGRSATQLCHRRGVDLEACTACLAGGTAYGVCTPIMEAAGHFASGAETPWAPTALIHHYDLQKELLRFLFRSDRNWSTELKQGLSLSPHLMEKLLCVGMRGKNPVITQDHISHDVGDP